MFLESASDTLYVASVGDCGCVLGSLDHGLAKQRSQGTLLTRATQWVIQLTCACRLGGQKDMPIEQDASANVPLSFHIWVKGSCRSTMEESAVCRCDACTACMSFNIELSTRTILLQCLSAAELGGA